jgi:hypothetical protein
MICVELSLFPKEQREACKTFPVLRQNTCCISEHIILVCCVLLLRLHPTLRKNYLQNTSSSAMGHTLLPVHNSYPSSAIPSSQMWSKSRISRPDPSSVLLRQKLEIISTIEITFSPSSVQNKRRGGVSLLGDTVLHERRRHRQHNRHITASETKLEGYLSKAIPHLRRAVLLLHYHTSTSSSLALLKHTSMPSRFFTSESAHRTPLLHSHSAPIAFSPHSYALLWVC